jgi:predicted O-methyltransferase YrrM
MPVLRNALPTIKSRPWSGSSAPTQHWSSPSAPQIIQDMFPQSRATSDAFIRQGMSSIELRKLRDLIMFANPTRVLEIGMAHGTSSVVMADALRRSSGGSLTSIDPNQTKPMPQGYGSVGLKAVSSLMPSHRLIEDFDHVVLPHLVEKGETFDFILVDGFHSFDLTFLDLFYADKLLQSGGLLVCHDSSSPAVHKALRWLERNKPYERLSPPLYTATASFLTKLWNRIFARQERLKRQAQWQMLVAYRKEAEHQMPEHVVTDF